MISNVKKKNIRNFIIFIVFMVICSFLLFHFSVIDIEKTIDLGEEFQYNIISMSSVIAGFLFTGLGILLSTIDKERINRLWEYDYLDCLYYAAFGGISSNIVTIIVAFIYLLHNCIEKTKYILVAIEIITIICALGFFIWCMWQLKFIITRLKKRDKK